MTDTPKPDTSNDLVVRGSDGDPLPVGTRMLEKESYERIVEGLKVMADAAAHLARSEPQAMETWNGIARKLDIARRIAVQRAGLGDVQRERQTSISGSNALPWRDARRRFIDGGKQASGGLRQLATCHRGDLSWSRMASEIEGMVRKISSPRRTARRLGLVLPPNYTQH